MKRWSRVRRGPTAVTKTVSGVRFNDKVVGCVWTEERTMMVVMMWTRLIDDGMKKGCNDCRRRRGTARAWLWDSGVVLDA